jgi:hypothetical protein
MKKILFFINFIFFILLFKSTIIKLETIQNTILRNPFSGFQDHDLTQNWFPSSIGLRILKKKIKFLKIN